MATFKSPVKTNIGTDETLMYSAPDTIASAIVIGLTVSNTSDRLLEATIWLQKPGGDSAHIVKNASLVRGGTIVLSGGEQKIVMEPDDEIRVYMRDPDDLDAEETLSGLADGIISVLER